MAALLLWPFLSGCGSRQEPAAAVPVVVQQDPTLVAKIGDREIHAGDLEREAAERRKQGRVVDSAAALLRERLQVEAMVLKARQEGLDREPDVLAEIDRLLVRTLRHRALSEELAGVTVSDDELREAYASRLPEFTQPGMDRLAMLFLECPRQASEAHKAALLARLEVARKQTVDREPLPERGSVPSFGEHSIDCSDDQASRYRGGDLGWFAQGKGTSRIPESILAAGRALEVGGLSGILDTDAGYYLVMKTDARPARTTAFDDVKATLQRSLAAEKRRVLEETFYASCLEQAQPVIYEDALSRVTLQPGGGAAAPEDSPPAMALLQVGENP